MQKLILLSSLLLVASGVLIFTANSYEMEEVGAWHLHTFFFEVKNSSVDEALSLRRTLRELINNRTLEECSLNQIFVGWYGPFPVSQYEMCCNKTSFNAAHSFMALNRGNLTIYVHPLTRNDIIDHTQRSSWMGQPVIMDEETSCWSPILPKPRPCPVYPNYSDELPLSTQDYQVPIPGTEDCYGLNKNFDILKDPY